MSETTEKRDRTGNRVGSETPLVHRVKVDTTSVKLRDALAFLIGLAKKWYKILSIVAFLAGGAFVATLGIGALGSETRAVDNRVTEVVKDVVALAEEVKPLVQTQKALISRVEVMETIISELPKTITSLDRIVATLQGEIRAIREMRRKE